MLYSEPDEEEEEELDAAALAAANAAAEGAGANNSVNDNDNNNGDNVGRDNPLRAARHPNYPPHNRITEPVDPALLKPFIQVTINSVIYYVAI